MSVLEIFQTRAIWKISQTQVQLILNSTRTHAITCLSIKGKITLDYQKCPRLPKMPSIKKKCPLSQPISAHFSGKINAKNVIHVGTEEFKLIVFFNVYLVCYVANVHVLCLHLLLINLMTRLIFLSLF